jgi:hypothetical protein
MLAQCGTPTMLAGYTYLCIKGSVSSRLIVSEKTILNPAYSTFEDNKDESIEIRHDSTQPFCYYISGQDEFGVYLLKFSTTGEKLFYQGTGDSGKEWVPENPSISLGRLLESVSAADLSGKMRQVLAWLLSKAVWQYYSSPLMIEPWSKENVHFLIERRTSQGHNVAGIFVNEPLLSVSIISDTSGNNHMRSDSRVVESSKVVVSEGPLRTVRKQTLSPHQLPKLLGLGVMLLEIQLGQSMESLWNKAELSHFRPRGKPNINTYYKFCNHLIEQQNLLAETPQDYFMPHIKDEERIREKLYVLINRVEVYVSQQKPDNVKPLSVCDFSPTCDTQPIALPQRVPRVQPYAQRIRSKQSRPGRTMAQMYVHSL